MPYGVIMPDRVGSQPHGRLRPNSRSLTRTKPGVGRASFFYCPTDFIVSDHNYQFDSFSGVALIR